MIKILNSFKVALERRIEIHAVKGYFDIQETNPDLINEIKNKIANHQLIIKRSVIENIIFPKNINVQFIAATELSCEYDGDSDCHG